jgi:hypothetical protein
MVYIGSYFEGVYALNGATGLKQWGFHSIGVSSPAIGPDGTVYIRIGIDVCAIESSSIGGLAKSPWPKLHGNARNTGQLASLPRLESYLESGVMLEASPTNLAGQIVGDPPPTYQWFFNGQLISQATNRDYAIASVSTNDVGTYMVIASNAFGTVTNGPITMAVNNVAASNFFGMTLTAPQDTHLRIESADQGNGPWSTLADLVLTQSPYEFIDLSAGNSPQRFYRTTQTNRLEGRWYLPGWQFTGAVGSKYQIEYVNAEVGYTNWQFLTNLTLPTSPYLFIDTTATKFPWRYYRTAPIP